MNINRHISTKEEDMKQPNRTFELDTYEHGTIRLVVYTVLPDKILTIPESWVTSSI